MQIKILLLLINVVLATNIYSAAKPQPLLDAPVPYLFDPDNISLMASEVFPKGGFIDRRPDIKKWNDYVNAGQKYIFEKYRQEKANEYYKKFLEVNNEIMQEIIVAWNTAAALDFSSQKKWPILLERAKKLKKLIDHKLNPLQTQVKRTGVTELRTMIDILKQNASKYHTEIVDMAQRLLKKTYDTPVPDALIFTKDTPWGGTGVTIYHILGSRLTDKRKIKAKIKELAQKHGRSQDTIRLLEWVAKQFDIDFSID